MENLLNNSIMGNKTTIRRGASSVLDPAQAATELYESIWQPDITLAVFFCSPEFDLEALAKELKAHFNNTPLIGCTTVGEITSKGYQTGGLTGFSLAMPDFVAATRMIDNLVKFSITEGQMITNGLLQDLTDGNRNPNGNNSFAFLLIDGMSQQTEIVVNALYNGMHDIPLFGGSAGTNPGDLMTSRTYLYYDGEFNNNRAVLALISTTRPFRVFKTQNFVPTETKLVITRAQPEARKVIELNGEPAAPEYRRMAGAEEGAEIREVSSAHPVGVYLGGALYLRGIGWANDDQSLTFIGAIDEGVILTLAREVDFIQSLRQQFDQIQAQMGQPELVIACDCFSRLIEMDRKGIKASAGELMMANHAVGFNTYGEQFNGMHMNQTLTGVAIGKAN